VAALREQLRARDDRVEALAAQLAGTERDLQAARGDQSRAVSTMAQAATHHEARAHAAEAAWHEADARTERLAGDLLRAERDLLAACGDHERVVAALRAEATHAEAAVAERDAHIAALRRQLADLQTQTQPQPQPPQQGGETMPPLPRRQEGLGLSDEQKSGFDTPSHARGHPATSFHSFDVGGDSHGGSYGGGGSSGGEWRVRVDGSRDEVVLSPSHGGGSAALVLVQVGRGSTRAGDGVTTTPPHPRRI
jgi:hypothetical protein